MEKLVSIIMPVYNAAKYLENALNDLMWQTYPHFELICVDDGSKDDSLKIVKSFQQKDGRVKIIEQENKGAGNARNHGLGYASGQYILFLDADDRFDPSLLEAAVGEAERLDTDILIFDAACFDSVTGQELSSEWMVRRERLPQREVFCYQDFPDDIFLFSHSVPWNKLYRADFIRKNNLIFQETPYGNDVLFVSISLIKAKRIAVLDKVLIHYRQNNPHSLSGRDARQRMPLCICEVMRKLQKALMEMGIYTKVQKSFANYAAEHLFWNLEIMEGESYSRLFVEMKNKLLSSLNIGSLQKKECMREDLYNKICFLKHHDEKEYLFYLIREKQWIIEKMNRDFAGLLAYEKKLQNHIYAINKSKKWVFSNKKIKKGDRIILYGAGEVGTDYYEEFKRENSCQVVAWVDENYQNIKEKEIRVESPETIIRFRYDYIIIAVSGGQPIREIKDKLHAMGVSDAKILCDLPMSGGVNGEDNHGYETRHARF